MNLCYHQIDYDINAEWNFFTTSHGNSPCDGAGGTMKRLAEHSSLQRPINNHILTQKVFHAGPDLGVGIVGICPEASTIRGLHIKSS